MNGNTEEMIEVAKLVKDCQRRLWNSRLSQNGGIYKFGEFVVKSPFLCSGRKSNVFKFWKKGDSDNFCESNIYKNGFSFFVIGEQGKIVVTNNPNLIIRKFVKICANQYPYVDFTWTREERRGVPEKTLSSLRFTLNRFTFVQYDYEDGVYKIMNHKGIPFSSINLPEDLNKVTEIRGVPFEKRIDFDSMTEEIIMKSGVRELSDAISQVTG